MAEPPSDGVTHPRYRLPFNLAACIGLAVLLKWRRSFRADARRLAAGITPPLQVHGREYIPQNQPFILTINHYARPGFAAWWLALAAASQIEQEMHWMMTAAWTFPERWFAAGVRPLSRWLFARLAHVYGFTTTPPLPPSPDETQARGEAVRRIMKAARGRPKPIIALAPEGRDFPGGALGWPPPGTGRFIYHLYQQGYVILPAGLYEQDGWMHLNFGGAYRLGDPHSHATGEIHPETYRLLTQRQVDLLLTRTVMRRIAVLLPERFRGEFN